MGYTVTLPYSTIELSTGLKSSLDAYTDIGFNTNNINLVTIPDFPSQPDYAYLDIIIQKIYDNSGADNYFVTGSKIQFRDTGLTFQDAGNINNLSCYVTANTEINSYYVIPGTVNIAQYVVPGESQMVAIYGKSQGNALGLRGMSGRLRLYFNAR